MQQVSKWYTPPSRTTSQIQMTNFTISYVSASFFCADNDGDDAKSWRGGQKL